MARIAGALSVLPPNSTTSRWARATARWLRADAPLAVLDAAVVFLVYLVALVLRFDGSVPDEYWGNLRVFALLAVAIHVSMNWIVGLYGQMWRYASITEARRLLLASAGATPFVLAAGLWSPFGAQPLPVSVVVSGLALTALGFGAIRFHSRLFAVKRRVVVRAEKRVLVVGAGQAGAMIVQDMLASGAGALEPVGFLDDDPRKRGRRIHGVVVLGPVSSLPTVVSDLEIDEVVVAVPSADGSFIRRVASSCETACTTLKILPSVREMVLAEGSLGVRDLRDVRLEDLLFRKEVRTDLEAVRALLGGRRVMITGAGGSIGSEIARQVMTFHPAELILLDHDETHLHDLMLDLGPSGAHATVVLADIRDRARVRRVFDEARPEIVFHAAAHKHVPILEAQPGEAVRTNVSGTAHVVDAAVRVGAERFVLISTDKAIRPRSVMGASKWLAEQLVRSMHGRDTILCAVRFGNVLGSRGSVIPTFMHQIEHGGPVTVTDPSMVRYFMSIGEAVQLVLQSAAMARGGEAFTLDMGEPVAIMELARRLIRLSGRVPGKDIEIRVTGARPGEKLAEEIVDPREQPVPSDHPSITAARPAVPDMPSLRRALRELESLARDGDAQHLADTLLSLANGGLPWSAPVDLDHEAIRIIELTDDRPAASVVEQASPL